MEERQVNALPIDAEVEETVGVGRRADLATLSQQGPATPDHVLRTKRVPMLGRDVGTYAAEYQAYFRRNREHAKEPKTQLDSAPRVVLPR